MGVIVVVKTKYWILAIQELKNGIFRSLTRSKIDDVVDPLLPRWTGLNYERSAYTTDVTRRCNNARNAIPPESVKKF